MAVLLARDYGFERKGILACIRALDDESGLDGAAHAEIDRVCSHFDADFEKSTNIHHAYIPINLRGMVVNAELKRFARRKAVVTDRLHGLLFAAITRTPCVAIGAATQKIREYAEMLRDTKAVFFIDKDLSRLSEAIRSATEIEEADYDLSTAPFDAMRGEIAEGFGN
jgi:pyruvyl transferase EpsI